MISFTLASGPRYPGRVSLIPSYYLSIPGEDEINLSYRALAIGHALWRQNRILFRDMATGSFKHNRVSLICSHSPKILAFRNEDRQSRGEKVDSARRLKNSQRSTRRSTLSYNCLFRFGAQKQDPDSLVQTLVRLLIQQMAPVGEQVIGGERRAVCARPARGGRFGDRLTMAGRLAVGLGHE